MLSAIPAIPQTPAAKSFWERYRKQFSCDPPLEAARAYDAVRFLSQAAREAKSLTFEKLAPKLKAVQNGDRLSGAYAIGADQGARGTAYILKIDNGRVVDHSQFTPAAEKKSS